MDYPSLWVDEAESSINALTILDHGYPTDVYLGLPLYENTMVRPWNGHQEYAYDDLSYSASGFAVYHSWLPLYAIAGSLKLFGIEPDSATLPPTVQHDEHAWRLRTVAPRVPSVLFSALFLVVLFMLGRRLGGDEVGVIAVVIAALSDGLVEDGHTARYYAASFALTTICGLCTWRLLMAGNWKNYLLAGLALVLMFHTHSLSFAVHSALLVLFGLIVLVRRDEFVKSVVLVIVVAFGILPWILATGYLQAVADSPKAWPLLSFPGDLVAFPLREASFSVPVAIGISLVLGLRLAQRYLPVHWIPGLRALSSSVLFLVAWGLLGFTGFLALMPAASYFESRIGLMTVVPGLLLYALLLGSALKLILVRREWRGIVGAVIAVFSLWLGDSLSLRYVQARPLSARHLDLLDILRDRELSVDARIYSIPNSHLLYQYYGGLPVQSVAAVRGEYLEECQCDVVMLYDLGPWVRPPPEKVASVSRAQINGMRVAVREETWEETWEELERKVATHAVADHVKEVWPKPQELSEFEKELASQARDYTREQMRQEAKIAPILRGYDIQNPEDWYNVFLFRFSGVESNWRESQNYLARVRQGTALVLPWAWVIYDAGKEGPALLHSHEVLAEIDAVTEKMPPRGACMSCWFSMQDDKAEQTLK